MGAHIIVRIPIIPGVNDGENLDRTASFLESLPQIDGIELMPYHEIGVAKYQALGLKYPLEVINPATNEEITRMRENFDHLLSRQ
jgi:pyruvate formate lyase activating enzyme